MSYCHSNGLLSKNTQCYGLLPKARSSGSHCILTLKGFSSTASILNTYRKVGDCSLLTKGQLSPSFKSMVVGGAHSVKNVEALEVDKQSTRHLLNAVSDKWSLWKWPIYHVNSVCHGHPFCMHILVDSTTHYMEVIQLHDWHEWTAVRSLKFTPQNLEYLP